MVEGDPSGVRACLVNRQADDILRTRWTKLAHSLIPSIDLELIADNGVLRFHRSTRRRRLWHGQAGTE